MKRWLWLLGIDVLLVFGCQGVVKDGGVPLSAVDSVLTDSASGDLGVVDGGHVGLDSVAGAGVDGNVRKPVAVAKLPQDTVKRYPIIHIGDKDFDPNRYLGPDATEAQRKYARRMIAEDSLRRARN